jgi:hypothetical protein
MPCNRWRALNSPHAGDAMATTTASTASAVSASSKVQPAVLPALFMFVFTVRPPAASIAAPTVSAQALYKRPGRFHNV